MSEMIPFQRIAPDMHDLAESILNCDTGIYDVDPDILDELFCLGLLDEALDDDQAGI